MEIITFKAVDFKDAIVRKKNTPNISKFNCIYFILTLICRLYNKLIPDIYEY
jgi:hypothetical protein